MRVVIATATGTWMPVHHLISHDGADTVPESSRVKVQNMKEYVDAISKPKVWAAGRNVKEEKATVKAENERVALERARAMVDNNAHITAPFVEKAEIVIDDVKGEL